MFYGRCTPFPRTEGPPDDRSVSLRGSVSRVTERLWTGEAAALPTVLPKGLPESVRRAGNPQLLSGLDRALPV